MASHYRIAYTSIASPFKVRPAQEKSRALVSVDQERLQISDFDLCDRQWDRGYFRPYNVLELCSLTLSVNEYSPLMWDFIKY